MAVESEKALQEFPYSDSDKRKKLDGYTLFGIGEAKDMMDANIGKRDMDSLESEPKFDLRKSLAWDSAFSTSPGFLEPEELFNALNSGHSQNGCDILGYEEHQLLSAKYLEPEIKSVTDEHNLRKSLAWDSAFFTSEGVLNPDELSLVNKGFKKSEIHILPRIEELWMSSESNCTIESDRSSLASLEVDLFEDIRASVHHLNEASSTVASSSRNRNRNSQQINSTKKLDGDRVPKLKVKFRPTSRRQTINGNQPERTAKESSTPPLRKFSAGSGVSDTTSPLKPPKILGQGRNIPVAPTKRVSLVSNEVNGESKIVQATNGKCLTVKPNPWKTCSDNPSSTPSLEISSLSPQSSMNESKVLGSPYSQFSTCRSSLKSSAIKKDTPNVNPTACIYTLTPPSDCRIISQITTENCGHPAYSSVKRNCPCISPSVSTDSSSPMSPNSTDHRCHDSMTSANESCRKSCIDSDASAQSDLEVQPHGQSFVAHDDKGSKYSSPCTEVKGSNSVSSGGTRIIKPSGLRMPSPKIGFFNVDDCMMPTENGGGKSHSGVQNAVSMAGACCRNLSGYANRSRPLKDNKSTKIFPQQTRRSLISGTMKSSKARSELCCVEKSREYLRNKEKMVNVRTHEQEFGVESCARMDRRGATETMGDKMIREREEQSCQRQKRLLQKEQVKAKTIYTGNDPHVLHENEKENLIGFENKLERLHEQVRTVDVSGDVVIEFDAKDGSSDE